MKISIAKIPITISLDPQCKVGNVYNAKGGPNKPGTRFFVVIAITGNVAHALGLDKDGNIVSTTSYGVQTFDRREVIAKVPDIARLNLEMIWEPV